MVDGRRHWPIDQALFLRDLSPITKENSRDRLKMFSSPPSRFTLGFVCTQSRSCTVLYRLYCHPEGACRDEHAPSTPPYFMHEFPIPHDIPPLWIEQLIKFRPARLSAIFTVSGKVKVHAKFSYFFYFVCITRILKEKKKNSRYTFVYRDWKLRVLLRRYNGMASRNDCMIVTSSRDIETLRSQRLIPYNFNLVPTRSVSGDLSRPS